MEADTFLKQANALDSIAASVHSCIAAAPPATQSVLLQSIILTGGRAKKIGADLETVIRAKAGGPVTVVTSSDPRLDVLVGGERFAALRCAYTLTHTLNSKLPPHSLRHNEALHCRGAYSVVSFSTSRQLFAPNALEKLYGDKSPVLVYIQISGSIYQDSLAPILTALQKKGLFKIRSAPDWNVRTYCIVI